MAPPDQTTDSEAISGPVIANLPLGKSFFVGLAGSAFFGFVLIFLLDFSRGAAALNLSDHALEILGWAIFVPFYLVVMLSLWKCAYNTSKPILGHLARIYAVITSLFFISILVTVILE